MTTQTPPHTADDDTLQVSRPAALGGRATSSRLAEMDLDPPSGPVPADVLAYFERAVAREARRAA